MIELGVGRRYVRALFALALEEGSEKAVGQDLKWFQAVLDESAELRRYLCDPRVTPATKKKTLHRVLPDELGELSHDFLLFVAERGRGEILPWVFGEYEALLLDQQGITTAHVTSAAALEKPTRDALVQQLEKVTGRTVRLEAQVDEELLGGVRIRVGSTLYDGSLRRALEELRRDLRQVALPATELVSEEPSA